VFCIGTSTADPAVDADAPPVMAKESPATPNAGATFFRLFRFELVLARAIGILQSSLRERYHFQIHRSFQKP
jgi:hypothetical protein